MLRIVQSKSASAAKDYFREGLAQGDYYSDKGRCAGQWFGEGAKRLGLAGAVTQEQFFALADNQDPATGERLTVRHKENHRPGSDFVFSPPKSVSSAWARSRDDRIADTVRDGILDTLRKDVEPEMKTRRRRAGQDGDVITGNMAGSLFMHDTTRPLADGIPDPHIHGHGYVFNATWAAHEHRWQAAQLYDLHLDAPYFEAAFEARVAKRLVELGHQIERREKGWEIAGVPQSVIDKDSRRTAEIEAEAKRRNIVDPARKAELGAKTRRGKEEGLLDGEALYQAWDDKLTPEERQAMAEMHRAAVAGENSPSNTVTAAQTMEHAIAHAFARESAVAVKALLTEALRYGVGSVLPEDVKKELSGHGLIIATIDGREVATTEAVLAEEQAMVRFARDGRGRCDPLGAGMPHVFKRTLNEGQQEAVASLLASRDRVMMLVGKAGSGKTTMLQELDDALHERGSKLLAFAPTSRASRGVLQSKGFSKATTIANLLQDESLQQEVRGNGILIDEVGLAGTQALRQVFDLAERENARVLVCGDPHQHRGVPRGAVLNILRDQAGLEPVTLSKIRRQEDPGHREAVESLSEGRAEEGFDRLDVLGFIKEIDDPEERYRTLAKDYADTLETGDTALILAPTHAEGRAASAAVREELKGRGRLGAEDHTLVRYESKGLTEAQKQDAVHYQPGDLVQWHRHAKAFKSGQQVTVVGREGGMVQVANAAGEVKALPLEHADRFELYRTTTLPVAAGERLRISRNGYTADGKKHRLNNGDLVTVAEVTPAGDLVDARGWVIAKNFGHLAPGVITSHASQGMDEDWCLVAQGSMSRGASSAQQLYVSASRGKKGVRIYTDDKAALRQAVSRSDTPKSAAEVWDSHQAEQQKAEAARQANSPDAARDASWLQRRRQRYLEAIKSQRQRAVDRLREKRDDKERTEEQRQQRVHL